MVQTEKLITLISFFLFTILFSFTGKSSSFIPLHKSRSFNELMSLSYTFDAQYASQNIAWKLVKNIYEQQLKKLEFNFLEKEKCLIPYLIHLIWLGSKLPLKSCILLKTWQKKHPNWTVMLWTDKEVKQLSLINQKAYDQARNYGEKSDILRYELLYKFGGLYIDHDFECLRSFKDFHDHFTFYTGLGYEREVLFYNGLIGAAPKHPIIKKCIDTIKETYSRKDGQTIHDIQKQTGPYFFTNCVLSLADQLSNSILLLPVPFFYAFPNNMRDWRDQPEKVRLWIKPESYAIHLWSCSWVTY